MNAVYDWIHKNISDVINEVASEYWGDHIVYLTVFFACLTLLFLNRETHKRGFRLTGAYSILLFVLVILNPLALRFYSGTKSAFALLPMCVISAYVITSKSKDVNSKIKRNAIMISLALLIILANPLLRITTYLSPINNYKLDDQGLIIANTILENADNKPVTVCYLIREGEDDDISVYETAEQYTGLLATQSVVINADTLYEPADYIVLCSSVIGDSSYYLEGYTKVLDTGLYSVYSQT